MLGESYSCAQLYIHNGRYIVDTLIGSHMRCDPDRFLHSELHSHDIIRISDSTRTQSSDTSANDTTTILHECTTFPTFPEHAHLRVGERRTCHAKRHALRSIQDIIRIIDIVYALECVERALECADEPAEALPPVFPRLTESPRKLETGEGSAEAAQETAISPMSAMLKSILLCSHIASMIRSILLMRRMVSSDTVQSIEMRRELSADSTRRVLTSS